MVYKAQLDEGKRSPGQCRTNSTDWVGLSVQLVQAPCREDRKTAVFCRPTHVPGKDEKDIKKTVSEMRIVSSPEKCGVIKITNINRKGLRHRTIQLSPENARASEYYQHTTLHTNEEWHEQ